MCGRLIEGVDYFVRFVRFPNRANRGAVIPNDDGTYDIYVNMNIYADETRVRRVVDHEIRHIILGHFDVLDRGIEELEREARGDNLPPLVTTLAY